MSRNGSGTFTIPNVMVSGATVTASEHNENYSDIGTELTNSVAADGQTAMTAPLKASNGTSSFPSFTFASDTDTGVFRKAANSVGIACGGTEVASFDSTGLTIVAGQSMPAGGIIPYAGSSAPTGWLLCNGASVLRADYAALFTAIGTTYGSADGTHFTLPDLTGRIIAGKEASATRLTSGVSGVDGGTLGATGGSQSHTLLTAEMPSHTHTANVTDPGHTHNVAFHLAATGPGSNEIIQNEPSSGDYATASSTTGITVANTSTGSDGAHANVQPTIVLNYIIKT